MAFETVPNSASAHYLQPHYPLPITPQSQSYLSVLSVMCQAPSSVRAFTRGVPSTGNSLLSNLPLAGSLSFIMSQLSYTLSSDILWSHNLK